MSRVLTLLLAWWKKKQSFDNRFHVLCFVFSNGIYSQKYHLRKLSHRLNIKTWLGKLNTTQLWTRLYINRLGNSTSLLIFNYKWRFWWWNVFKSWFNWKVSISSWIWLQKAKIKLVWYSSLTKITTKQIFKNIWT